MITDDAGAVVSTRKTRPYGGFGTVWIGGTSACGELETRDRSSDSPLEGTLLLLEGPSSEASEGQLRAVQFPEAREEATLPNGVNRFGVSRSSSGRELAFETFDGDQAWVSLVDVDSGRVRQLARGRMPIGSDHFVAYCSEDNWLAIAPVDGAAPAKEVIPVPNACFRGAWTKDTLAFLLLGSPSGQEDGVTAYVWEATIQQVVPAPISVAGYGDVSRSPDGKSLLYSNGETVVEIDLLTEQAAIIGTGESPRYASNANIYAVITSHPGVEIRDDSGTVQAKLLLPEHEAAELGIGWSPDGDFIAIVTPQCLLIWRWASDSDARCVLSASASSAFLSTVVWFPPAP